MTLPTRIATDSCTYIHTDTHTDTRTATETEPAQDALALHALESIGLTPVLREQARAQAQAHARGHDPAAHPGLPPLRPWRVTEVQRETLSLHDGQAEQPGRVLPALRHALQAQDDALAVGDWVLAAPDAHGGLWAHHRLPPRAQIARRTGEGGGRSQRQVIVSHVDTALLVMGLDHDFNLRRLERYLALVRLAGVLPVVVLTKADLCEAPQVPRRAAEVQRLLPPGGAVVAVDGRGGAAREALRPWLQRGQTLALLGSSGAGKSTLTNTLTLAEGAQAQDTGPTRAGDGRGRHTTTARSLHRTPQGACIIDTPGLRALRLDADPQALGQVFDDIGALALHCRFRDCRHQGEPGCAVAAGVAPERLRSFHKLEREARRDQMTVLERQAEHAQWRIRSKAARRRMAEKCGG
jgi:ribosome biogenesis GTPase